MKKVIFLRSQDPNTDSRLQRYLMILKERKIPYLCIGWLREKKEPSNHSSNTIYYTVPAEIGGGSKNIFPLIKWNFFIFKTLWSNRKNFSSIHSVDFDTCVIAYIFAKIFRKHLIVDIYDKYTDSRNISGKIKRLIDSIEKFICQQANTLILPDSCRITQLGLSYHQDNILIFENIPLPITSPLEQTPFPHSLNTKLHISYVGILEKHHRGLENLIKVVSLLPDVSLTIAGQGALKEWIIQTISSSPNITFLGKVPATQALSIATQSDLIVGMYYKSTRNHLFASPNKYYEHLMLGKPLLTTEGTSPGNKVLEHHTGIAIGETKEELYETLVSVKKEDLEIMGKNARQLWEANYSDYLTNFSKKYANLFLQSGVRDI